MTSADSFTLFEFTLMRAREAAKRQAYFAEVAVSVGDSVYYPGSQTQAHGEYWVAAVPWDDPQGRGYVLSQTDSSDDGFVLRNVSRSSFTLTPPF